MAIRHDNGCWIDHQATVGNHYACSKRTANIKLVGITL